MKRCFIFPAALGSTAAVLVLIVITGLARADRAADRAPAGSIQAAIDAAHDGDTISITAGAHVESLTVARSITLTGISSATTIIQAMAGQRAITVTAGHDLRLIDLGVTGGQAADDGGGIFVADGSLAIVRCRIYGNHANGAGGAVYQYQSAMGERVDVADSLIQSNTASLHAGGLYVQGDAALTNTLVTGNSAGNHGGGVFVYLGQTRLSGGAFISNSAGWSGGGVLLYNGLSLSGTLFISNSALSGGGLLQWYTGYDATLVNAHLERNRASVDGGGLLLGGSATALTNTQVSTNTSRRNGGGLDVLAGTLSIVGSLFGGNVADSGGYTDTAGGGIYFTGSALTLESSSLRDNRSDCVFCSSTAGGGLYMQVTAPSTITGSSFVNNNGWFGGAIDSDGNTRLLIAGTSLRDNDSGYGGGMYTSNAAVQIVDSEFARNYGENEGGAIKSSARLSLYGVRVLSNTADARGGGIFSLWEPIDIDRSRFENNRETRPDSGFGGGALYARDAALITNTLFVSNSAAAEGDTILVTDAPFAVLKQVTITAPRMVTGTAIRMLSGSLHLTNTIIANYTLSISMTGSELRTDYDLFSPATFATDPGTNWSTGSHNLFGANPRFVNPAASDYHLLPESPAVDSGADTGIVTDLDGVCRPSGPGFDMGAYELLKGARLCTIQATLDAAQDGDTISLPAGVYTESVTVNRTITLTGVSSATTIIRAVTGHGVINVSAGHDLRLAHLTVAGGTAGAGGGVYLDDGGLFLLDCTVRDNAADYGGGVFQNPADERKPVNAVASRFERNHANFDGGAVFARGDVALTDTTIITNTADRHGGGLHADTGQVRLRGGTMSANSAGGNGGAINLNDGLDARGTRFIANSAGGNGGAVLQWNAGQLVSLSNAYFEFNRSGGDGGGLMTAQGAHTWLTGSTFIANTARGRGGAMTVIGAGATLRLITGTIAQNSTDTLNTAGGDALGGGIYFQGSALSIVASSIRDNVAAGGAARGGGVYAEATHPGGILATSFVDNSAPAGGAVYARMTSAITNCLFINNHGLLGSDLNLGNNSRTTLLYATIARPAAGGDYAIALAGGSLNVTDTIVTNHSMAISQTGGLLNADYSLFYGNARDIASAAGSYSHGSHLYNRNPRFINLANGNYHLGAGSGAIDSGAAAGVYTDFDGRRRPLGKGYDIGAYESYALVFAPFVRK